VEEQKPETEPPMKVKITFEKLINLMDRMYEQGVRRVQFCLVGWNMRGHDGRYPQLFPVEEALGGETKLREAIAHAQSLGYAIVCHTNSSDCYRIADCFSEDDVLKYADGELQKNTCWSGGQMYNLSPFAALERARTDLPQVAAFGFSGLHYIDVLSVVLPRWGKDARGIVSIKDCIACWKKIMTIAHDEFGGFASEGGFDFCAEELDFGLYANFDMYQPLREFEDEIIPFWQLIYHGLIMSNPSTDLVNLPFVSREKQLRFVEYGGRPAMYYYARFVDQTGDRKNWMGTDDLTCDAEEDTAAGIQAIKQMQDEYDKLWDLQYCLMERYERLTDNVTMVAYDNGTRIVTNYGNEPFLLEGVTVQPMEYARINETKE